MTKEENFLAGKIKNIWWNEKKVLPLPSDTAMYLAVLRHGARRWIYPYCL
jgi:hypothetical protein